MQTAGADLLTIADCPIARARMDSSLVACRVHRELGMNVLPHMTCRDRNLNATKALLLGLYAEGVREVLAITGDPHPHRGAGRGEKCVPVQLPQVGTVYRVAGRRRAGDARTHHGFWCAEPERPQF